MSRLKLLVVAIAVAALGALFMLQVARRELPRIDSQTKRQLAAAAGTLATRLEALQSAQLSAVKQVAQSGDIAKALDEHGHPTGAALEAAVSAVGKLKGPAAKADTVVVIAGGAAGRYRVGAANRFDPKADAFSGLGPSQGARTLFATLDGLPSAIAVAPVAGDDGSAVGQLALGWSLDEAFAKQLAASLPGLDVSFVSAGKVIASSLPPLARQGLGHAARAGDAGFGFGPLTDERFILVAGLPPQVAVKVPPLPLGAERLTAARGLALPLGGGALLVLSAREDEPLAAIANDQRMLLGGVAGIVLLCLLLLAFGSNPAKGLARVAAAADKLAQGDLSIRAPTEGLASGVRRVAVALNAIAANAGQRSTAAAASAAPARAGQSLVLDVTAAPDALLQSAAQTFDASQTLPVPPEEAPALDATRPSARVTAEAAPLPTPPPPPKEDDFAGLFAQASPQRSASSIRSAPTQTTKPPAPPPHPMEDDGDGYNPDATVVAQVPEALVRAMRATAPSSYRPPAAASSGVVELPAPREPSRVSAAPANAAAGSEEGHFQQVFKEFVQAREKCGEPADGLTYDRFAVKLRKNKEQLVQKYACKSVRFQVYVKEGKAALKATPVKE
ncbi:MAG: MXAN_5187 family protein [Deltaproteobacteria bacterium]